MCAFKYSVHLSRAMCIIHNTGIEIDIIHSIYPAHIRNGEPEFQSADAGYMADVRRSEFVFLA